MCRIVGLVKICSSSFSHHHLDTARSESTRAYVLFTEQDLKEHERRTHQEPTPRREAPAHERRKRQSSSTSGAGGRWVGNVRQEGRLKLARDEGRAPGRQHGITFELRKPHNMANAKAFSWKVAVEVTTWKDQPAEHHIAQLTPFIPGLVFMDPSLTAANVWDKFTEVFQSFSGNSGGTLVRCVFTQSCNQPLVLIHFVDSKLHDGSSKSELVSEVRKLFKTVFFRMATSLPWIYTGLHQMAHEMKPW